jgi:hypothetical protein
MDIIVMVMDTDMVITKKTVTLKRLNPPDSSPDKVFAFIFPTFKA